MQIKPMFAALLLCTAVPASAAFSATFEQRVVAILSAGGTPETMQSRLDRVSATQTLSPDQQIAMDALRTLVRGKGKAKGLSVVEAEAFAARNPASPASGMLVAEAALANHEAQRSADTLIATAARSGSLVQLISPATVSKLITELDGVSDQERIAKLAITLLDADWNRGSASLRSFLALTAIRADLAAGRTEAARRFLDTIRTPASLQAILIDNRLSPLRNRVQASAGPQLGIAWRNYLTVARDDWLSKGDVEAATGYVEALKQAGQYEAIADAFVARFTRGYNCPTDLVARSVGGDLADSLARTGRWARAEEVMRRLGGVSPPTYASMLLERGEFGRALALLDRSLQAVHEPRDEEGRKALAWLNATRACAAYRAGKGEGTSYDPALLDLPTRLSASLCLNHTDEARALVIAALADEDERADALRWVQPFADQPEQSPFRKEMGIRARALQHDPAVIAAATKVGVILDWPLTAAVPPRGDLAAPRPALAWQCGDEPDGL